MAMQYNTIERSTVACTSGNSARLGNRAFLGGKQVAAKKSMPRAAAYAPLKVDAALSAEGKTATIDKLKAEVDRSMLVAAMTYQSKGMSVAKIKELRKSLPATTKVVVSKNSLVKRAVADTPFAPMAEELSGPNCFIFADEEGVKETIKTCNDLRKTMKKANVELKWTAACMDGTLYSSGDVDKLETLPTRLELIAKVASLIKQVPTKTALAVKAVPNKVGYAAKAYKDKLEEEQGGSA
jgi:large subunit ribosomal protein L10